MKTRYFAALSVLLAGLLFGCGGEKKVVVGEPGKSGLIKRDIDRAKDVGAKASEYQQTGEREVYGG